MFIHSMLHIFSPLAQALRLRKTQKGAQAALPDTPSSFSATGG